MAATSAKAAFGRSLSDFRPLLAGEERLLQACRQGEVAELGPELPEADSDETRVRAAFLRFLLLGGDEQALVHERGVRLWGARVEGRLDLGACRVPYNMDLTYCHFDDLLFAQDARVDGLMTLQGSLLSHGIEADRMQCTGGLFLRNGFKASGLVRLVGAQIGGNLDCTGGQFEVKEGDALSADRAVVKGDVFLSGGFKASGQVRLLGAQIGGSLECIGGQFEVKEGDALSADGAAVMGSVFLSGGFKASGQVRLLGAQIGGVLSCIGGQFEGKEGDALSADGAVVKGDVFLSGGFKASGQVRLLGAQIGGNLSCTGGQFDVKEGPALSTEGAQVAGAWYFRRLSRPARVLASHMRVGVLVDELEAWAAGSVLDGLTYGSLGGAAPTQASARLAWLKRQTEAHLGETRQGEDFRPQPWRQLQRVLLDMGHSEDAHQVGIAFQARLRRIGRIGQSPPGTWAAVALGKRVIAQAAHALFGLLSGYGYRPMRLMAWMAGVWFCAGIGYWALALPPFNAIGPSDPLVFQHEAYRPCNSTGHADKPAGNWYLCAPLPAEYSTFSPLAYSLDILLPLVDLGQEKAWGPLVPTPEADPRVELINVSWGHVVRWLIWFQTLFGWIGSLLLVAIVSGLARRTEE